MDKELSLSFGLPRFELEELAFGRITASARALFACALKRMAQDVITNGRVTTIRLAAHAPTLTARAPCWFCLSESPLGETEFFLHVSASDVAALVSYPHVPERVQREATSALQARAQLSEGA